MFGGLALAGAGVVAGIGGVDPDQVAADGHDLVLRGGRLVRGSLVRCHGTMVAFGHHDRWGVPGGWRDWGVWGGRSGGGFGRLRTRLTPFGLLR